MLEVDCDDWASARRPRSPTDYAPRVTVFHNYNGLGRVVARNGDRVCVHFADTSLVTLSAAVCRAKGIMVTVHTG